jgi:hypothetical protein
MLKETSLRFDMTPRNKRINRQENHNQEIEVDPATILRTVSGHEAFYFYEAVGKPTGEAARSLPEFLNKLERANSGSILFHAQRKDFQNWIENTIGDAKLARKISSISTSNVDHARTKIRTNVENRIRELRDSSVTILDTQQSAVTHKIHA